MPRGFSASFPPLPEQCDQGWVYDWAEWKGGIDHAFSEIYPQVGYLTEEVEKLQQHLAAQSLQENVEELLHQSSGLKHFAKSQIDEHLFALSEMMKTWIKE